MLRLGHGFAADPDHHVQIGGRDGHYVPWVHTGVNLHASRRIPATSLPESPL